MGLAVANRALFVTDEGGISLGLTSIAKGDEIHVLPGGRLPFVLRNVKPPENLDTRLRHAESRTFTVVGDCFLQGSMDSTRGFTQQGSLPKEVLRGAIGIIEKKWTDCVQKLRGKDPFWRLTLPSISEWHVGSQGHL